MPNLLGIITPLRKFFSNTSENITISVHGSDETILEFKQHRTYKIPDFQREIRWGNDNIALLIDDIFSGSKYLGNVILTDHSDNTYSIIDGQQRITILTMILSAIEYLHAQSISTISPCNLQIESFYKFADLLARHFSEEQLSNPAIIDSDKLKQRFTYANLWSFILSHSKITDKENAQQLLENIRNSYFNIIMNKSDDLNNSIRYFIDVNLKGKQLDTEDIFKSYLFKNDPSPAIRDEWYRLKTNVIKASEYHINYPLLSLIEHGFYCELYKDSKYKGLEFGQDFLTKREVKTQVSSQKTYREGLHLIELINDNSYMLSFMKRLNRSIEMMIAIIDTQPSSPRFKSYFPCQKNIDSDELNVIHNFIGKILRDSTLLPKALIMKYILTTLIPNTEKNKKEYRKIYGVYLLSVLFTIFESKKSKELLLSILKSSDDNWYQEALRQIQSYFSPEKVTKTRLWTQYKLATNEEEDDYRFRCKSLATVYNFFLIKDDEIVIRKNQLSDLSNYITDNNSFSLEHFIVSDSNTKNAKIVIDGNEYLYTYNDNFFKQNVNNLFNYIFIPTSLNTVLDNYWLPHKMELIKKEKIKCSYSLMILEQLHDLSNTMTSTVTSPRTLKDDLDLFYARDYSDYFIAYARRILEKVILHLKTP